VFPQERSAPRAEARHDDAVAVLVVEGRSHCPVSHGCVTRPPTSGRALEKVMEAIKGLGVNALCVCGFHEGIMTESPCRVKSIWHG
jgi:hypothetical protein